MTEKNYNINEDDFNELLRKSFLEENADNNIDDDISKIVFSQEYDVKIDPEKEKNFKNRLSGKPGIGKGLFFGIILSVVLIVTAIIIVFNPNTEDKHKANKIDKDEKINNTISNDSQLTEPNGLNYYAIGEENKTKDIEVTTQVNDEIKSLVTLPDTNPVSQKKNISTTETGLQEMFVLNPKLIKRYSNIKQMMMEKLLNKDKKLYRSISEGNVNYKGENTGVTAFTIRSCVVTNLEYRTFLIDLLIKGRRSDYNKAKVKQDIWNNIKCQKLAEVYFKEEEYNDFPVVNISKEGAELFYSWLEQETKQYAKTLGIHFDEFKLRLPYDVEWMLLAEFGYSSINKNVGYLTIFDINEGYIDRALDRRIKSLQKKYKFEGPVDELYATNRYGMTESQIFDIFNKGFELRPALPLDTIFPERMKDYTNIGHVSEMIFDKQTGKQIVFGTNWRDKEEFQDMMKDFTKFSGSPFVGMRIVVEFENAPEYKKPAW